jgi:hypothetical protein
MPYILQSERGVADIVTTAGQLNHDISQLLGSYVLRHGLKYETLNAAIGACQAALLEFNRRVVAPYEDSCIIKNGDLEVYECLLSQINNKEK